MSEWQLVSEWVDENGHKRYRYTNNQGMEFIPPVDDPLGTFGLTDPTKHGIKHHLKGHVEKFMYNKIRILLYAIGRKHGFPVDADKRVVFLGYLMFGIPYTHALDTHKTLEDWKFGTLRKWREVAIYRVPIPNTQEEMWFALMNMLSGSFLHGAKIANHVLRGVTYETWQIFENLVVKSGLNDIVIDANWDKIKALLIKHGYNAI